MFAALSARVPRADFNFAPRLVRRGSEGAFGAERNMSGRTTTIAAGGAAEQAGLKIWDRIKTV